MHLKKIEIRKLYGSFSNTLSFDRKLNLLVGINGSGKTSLLNCIDWLLRPNLAALATTQFDKIQLGFTHKSKSYTLLAKQDRHRLELSEIESGLFPNPIVVALHRPPAELHAAADTDRAITFYENLSPEPKERALWGFLAELPHPLTISLDRTIAAETDSEYYLDRGAKLTRVKDKKPRSPVRKVQEVAREKYAAYREQIYALNEELKTKLVISAFRNPAFTATKVGNAKRVSQEDIEKLEKKVTTTVSTSLGLTQAVAQISKYFLSAKQMAGYISEDESLSAFFWSQYKQIDDFAEAFDEYERAAAEAFEALGSFLRAVNFFFADSRKSIGFNEQDGSLAFRFLDEKSQSSGSYISLDRLSSGEVQIITLLSFLAFISGSDKVFVVDEPELSLHPKWQEHFLDAVLSQAPKGTQIILATHSPEIVAKHRERCIVLRP